MNHPDLYETSTCTLTNEDIAQILSATDENTLMADDNINNDIGDHHQKQARKKKSRTSKHTPTTFLIAKASDFRALVQQLTGCQSASSYKGTINLKFGAQEHDDGGDELMTTSDIDKVSAISMLQFNLYDQKTRRNNYDHQPLQQVQQLLGHEEQESSSSVGEVFVSTCNGSSGPYSTTTTTTVVVDDLVDMGNVFSNMQQDYSLDNYFGDYSSEIVADEPICDDGYGSVDEAILFCGYIN